MKAEQRLKNKDELGYTARRKIKREERKGGGSQIRR